MIMSSETYRFKIGAFQCIAVSDGTFTYSHPSSFLFTNAPKERLDQKLREHNIQPEQWTEWISSYTCAVINTGRHQVLVDTGAGGLGSNTGRLLQNLLAERITPADIDIVILTHAHPDHIGGSTVGEAKPAFPRARFVMRRKEWDFWTSMLNLAELKIDESIKALIITVARLNLSAIRDQLDLIEHETDIVPGIRAIAAPGHTPGHMALDISSKGESLLILSDAVIHPIHMESSDWYSAVDLIPEQAVNTRRRLLKKAVDKKSKVLVFHFPFPALGHVVRSAEAWRWQRI